MKILGGVTLFWDTFIWKLNYKSMVVSCYVHKCSTSLSFRITQFVASYPWSVTSEKASHTRIKPRSSRPKSGALSLWQGRLPFGRPSIVRLHLWTSQIFEMVPDLAIQTNAYSSTMPTVGTLVKGLHCQNYWGNAPTLILFLGTGLLIQKHSGETKSCRSISDPCSPEDCRSWEFCPLIIVIQIREVWGIQLRRVRRVPSDEHSDSWLHDTWNISISLQTTAGCAGLHLELNSCLCNSWLSKWRHGLSWL